MGNLFAALPAPAANGSGAAVDVSAFGAKKTLTVTGSGGAFVTIEMSNELVPTHWAPVTTFQTPNDKTLDVAARWMRATVSNYDIRSTPPAPVVNLGGNDDGATAATLVAPAVNGAGAAVDTSALPELKTVHVGNAFTGALNVELSVDAGVTWSTVMSFSGPGQQSAVFTAGRMRVTRNGVSGGGLPLVNIEATVPGGGGSGGSSAGSSIEVADEGVVIPAGPFDTLNFVGAGVTATDGGGGVATITIAGGAGGATPDDVTITGDGTVGDPLTAAGGPAVNVVFDEEWAVGYAGLDPIGTAGWYDASAGGGVTNSPIFAGKLGVLSMSVDNTNDIACMLSSVPFRPDQGDQLIFETRVAVSALAANYTFLVGFNDVTPYQNTAGAPANPVGAWWLLDSGGNASGSPGLGNFWSVWKGSYDAGSGNCVLTSVLTAIPSVALGNNDGSGANYIDLKIIIDSVANEVRFYADGVLVNTMAGVPVLDPAMDAGSHKEGMFGQLVMRAYGNAASRLGFADWTRMAVINVNRNV